MKLTHLPARIWTLGILVGCWIPITWLPKSSGEGPREWWQYLLPTDKLVHLVMFGGFTCLWFWALRGPRRMLRVLIAGAALGVITELGQAIPILQRGADLQDFYADLVGLALGALVAPLLERLWTRLRPSVAEVREQTEPASSAT